MAAFWIGLGIGLVVGLLLGGPGAFLIAIALCQPRDEDLDL